MDLRCVQNYRGPMLEPCSLGTDQAINLSLKSKPPSFKAPFLLLAEVLAALLQLFVVPCHHLYPHYPHPTTTLHQHQAVLRMVSRRWPCSGAPVLPNLEAGGD